MAASSSFRGLLYLQIYCSLVQLYLGDHYPSNEYEFSLKREQLLKAEKEYGEKTHNLNEIETIVDNYLKYLKWKEFQATKTGDFPPLRRIEDMIDIIKQSELYNHLKTLPKGGNMHTHENHQLSKRTLLEIVWASEDFEHLYMLPPDHPTEPWTLDFFINSPETESWLNVKNSDYSMEEILQHQTLLGILGDNAKNRPTDSQLRWKQMDPLWGRNTKVMGNQPIKKRYLEELLRSSLAEGVQYLETRSSLGKIYVLDPSAVETNGKRYLDNNDGELDITMALEVTDEIREQHPEFIDFRRIINTYRVRSEDDIMKAAERAIGFQEDYPDHIIGLDMVGGEDGGNSHLFYVEPFTKLQDPDTKESRIPLYLHTAETNWPEDLITSNNDADPVAAAQNAYEAILLGVKRIGHGLGFIKHPYLLQILKEKKTPIEICVISNQILGFIADIRNHPAIQYHRMGIPIVLGADDPGTFGVDDFTLDWFQAYMGWGLDLSDLKTFALNSLRYSGMSDEQKEAAITNKWLPKWEEYITEKVEHACALNLSTENVTFARLFPREGALEGETKVHVFGRHFEAAICNPVKCKFGEFQTTNGHYVSQNHLICTAPDPETDKELSVDVKVSLDGGDNFLPVGEKFTYKYEAFRSTTNVSPGSNKEDGSNDAVCNSVKSSLLIAAFMFTWHVITW